MEFPVKLDDAYPCRGVDADGVKVYFDDLLFEGQKAGQTHSDFPDDVFPPLGTVVARADGLWIEADSSRPAESHGEGERS